MLSGTTKWQDIYTGIANFLKSNYIDISNLTCVVSNGALSIVGEKNKGFIIVLSNYECFLLFIHYYCLIHIENLASNLKYVLEISKHFKLIVENPLTNAC